MKVGKAAWAPLGVAIVFFLVPVAYESTQQLALGDQTRRAAVVAVLAIALLLGTASAGFFAIGVARRVVRRFRPTDLPGLRADANSIVIAAGLLVATIAVTLALYSPAAAVLYVLLLAAYLAFSLPPGRRRLNCTVDITVRCTPQAAFGIISDPRQWPRFQPELEVLEPVDVPIRVGSIVRQRVRIGRFVVTGEDQITVVEPDRRLGSATLHSSGQSSDMYELEPVPEGTRIRYGYQSVIALQLAAIGGVVGRSATIDAVRARRAAALQRIKEILETPAQASAV